MNDKELKKEYDKKWYQKNKERSTKQTLEWRKNNTERYEESAKKRLNTERGYMTILWQSVKAGGKHNSFKDFDDFYNHWLEQKKIYGRNGCFTLIRQYNQFVPNTSYSNRLYFINIIARF